MQRHVEIIEDKLKSVNHESKFMVLERKSFDVKTIRHGICLSRLITMRRNSVKIVYKVRINIPQLIERNSPTLHIENLIPKWFILLAM